VDAITLSMARLHGSGDLTSTTATRAIVIAAAANTVLKGGILVAVGRRELRRTVLPGVGLIVASTVVAVLLV